MKSRLSPFLHLKWFKILLPSANDLKQVVSQKAQKAFGEVNPVILVV